MRQYSSDKSGQPDLPKSPELRKIIMSEATRALPPGKESIHYPVFDSIMALLRFYGQPTEMFEQSSAKIDEVVEAGTKVVSDLSRAILQDHSVSASGALNQAYDYLAEEDQPQPSDIIMVFGAKTPHRIEKGIELFKQGFGQKILITGSKPFYADGHEVNEAQTYRQLAIESGVPEDRIIVEDQAITIADNVRRSLNLLDELGLSIKSLISVLSPYAQRRAYTTLQKYLPDEVKIYRVNGATLEQYQRDNWYKSEIGTKVILNEFVKMRASVAFNSS